MQTNVNVIVVEGKVSEDFPIQYTTDGLAFSRFNIENKGVGYKDGEAFSFINEFEVSVWGKLAEICATYLKAGSIIVVLGRLKQRNSKQNVIVAQDVKFLPKKKKEA